MKKRSRSAKDFNVNKFLRLIKKGQIIKTSYPDVNFKKVNQRLERLEIQRTIDISKAYYSKFEIEKSSFYSQLALLLSIIAFVFSIWK